mmetsp:Transcript_10992/g.13902  ORF Transcript_10992/g.13902 Transcript_10992/m.13902 type:complete len:102 (-) Transcript_10992:877-1182(-)
MDVTAKTPVHCHACNVYNIPLILRLPLILNGKHHRKSKMIIWRNGTKTTVRINTEAKNTLASFDTSFDISKTFMETKAGLKLCPASMSKPTKPNTSKLNMG